MPSCSSAGKWDIYESISKISQSIPNKRDDLHTNIINSLRKTWMKFGLGAKFGNMGCQSRLYLTARGNLRQGQRDKTDVTLECPETK